jgi:nucleoside-diphosphate-sugar epimerase
MPVSVLVTGAGGYIGSVLVPKLLESGYVVVAFDNFTEGQPTLASVCGHPNFDVVRGDVRDDDVVGRLLRTADFIIPLAALVGAPLCDQDPFAAVSINRDAIETLTRRTSSNQAIIFPTTNSGYGVGERGKFCDENSPLRPISLYGRLKVEAERIVLDGGKGVTLRLATAFGMSPRMRTDLLVNDFTARAVTERTIVVYEGKNMRNYVHVRDIAKAFIHSIENFDSMRGEPFNVGLSDANLTKLELCGRIKLQVRDLVYIEAPIGQDPDKRDYMVSNEKIEATGFKPDWSLDDGISELITGYKMMRMRRFSNI